MKLSIAIPTSDMVDKDYFFKRCLESLWMQEFQDFEIVVTDNSEDNVIRDICEFYLTGINYSWNPRKGMAQNTNEAVKLSKGELIKILYMDDYLLHKDVLEDIVKKFKGGWLISGCDNNANPHWTDDIHTGNNKLGGPSALTIENKDPLLFDENLSWLLDVVYYKGLYERYGEPTLMVGKHIGIGVGEHQFTHLLPNETKQKEYEYVMKNYE